MHSSLILYKVTYKQKDFNSTKAVKIILKTKRKNWAVFIKALSPARNCNRDIHKYRSK